MKHRLSALLLAAALLAACAANDGPLPASPSEAPSPDTYEVAYTRAEADAAAMDFAVRLLQNTGADGKNVLVSPFSVWSALGMTGLGAEGATLAEMADALGLAPNVLGPI